jgi:acetolactate synthase regulatory subunit
MHEQVNLVTSVAPHNVENQQRAIDSWLRAGFSVISMNAESEIDQTRRLFPELKFQPVTRDASSECERPLVYLDDVFAFLRKNGTQVCGLINSDIHLRAGEAAVQYVVEQARGSLLLACRTDVESLESRTGEVFKHGFDVFLFDKGVLDLVPSSQFCLGQPWWDYWFPSCILKMQRQIPLKLVTFPFIAHIRHPSDWDRDRNFEKYGLHCMQYFDPAKRQELMKQPPEQLRQSIGTYSAQVAHAIWGHSRWLSYSSHDA